METLKFRTNIGCPNCVKTASILLGADTDILDWHVDINHPEKILTIKGVILNKHRVIYNLRFAGFKIESIE